ncbi:MAG: class I SAM-dependent methyltransferase [Alphaproteobacteria bacterium]|nr:MAG: class I SAM-dependent methyltransferase [Alphaproteobacteria bacterium]
MTPLLAHTDKSFWHGYLDFYAAHLPLDVKGTIVEFGVFKGHSIRWLADRFPNARIVGADILPTQPEWPTDQRITYARLDQDDVAQISGLFASLQNVELIIEDGSHIPKHQSACLKLGLPALAPGGTYVLEDIHTSHPNHALYANEFGGTQAGARAQTSLSVLLAFEHMFSTGAEMTAVRCAKLAEGSHFNAAEIESMFKSIESIKVYKRAVLPHSCWRCGSSDFDYHAFKCVCGAALMDAADSMTIVIKKRQDAASAACTAA